jgi:hypothetical protein
MICAPRERKLRPYRNSEGETVNGERRSLALLRPVVDTTAQSAVRDRILEAYAEYEDAAATATA